MCFDFCYWNKKFSFNTKQPDSKGRNLILNVTIDDAYFVLVNLYKANTEKVKGSILSNFLVLLETFYFNPNKQIIFARHLDLFPILHQMLLGGSQQ